MTTATVTELTNQIENKLSEIHELRRDLRELNHELRVERERIEGTEEEVRHGRSVRWEEIETDIYYTEVEIRGITREVETLKSRLYELISVGPVIRIAFE